MSNKVNVWMVYSENPCKINSYEIRERKVGETVEATD